MPQFPAIIELSDARGGAGYRVTGLAFGDAFANSIASLGDINGDGFDDVIVGAPQADVYGRFDAGHSYVVFGNASGHGANLDVATLDGTNGFRLEGATTSDGAGWSVAGAGDVNGDGFADILIGAPTFGTNNVGATYVVFGTDAGFPPSFDLAALNGSNGFRVTGAGAGGLSGGSVASAGDVNGDGYSDIIVGARSWVAAAPESGGAFVVFGKASGFSANVPAGNLNGSDGFLLLGAAGGDTAGWSVASAGDVDGDGFADILIGAPHVQRSSSDERAGVTYLVFGKESGFAASASLASIDGTNGFRFDGISEDDFSGRSVASAGDVNGDGRADIIIGVHSADAPDGSPDAGESYVVFGGLANLQALDLADGTADGRIALANLDGGRGFTISSSRPLDQAGTSVSSAGDVNGDGFDDMIVGVPGNDPNGDRSGAAFVLFGKRSGLGDIDIENIDGSNGFMLAGVRRLDQAGTTVASAGDVNDDGFGDLIVGRRHATGPDPGGAYVVFGRAPDEAVHRNGTEASQTLAGGAFDDVLSGQGGDDTLHGNGGDDRLLGNVGDDVLIGGKGQDMLFGGAGDDTFVFRAMNETFGPTADRIRDFEAGDRIDLSRIADTAGVAFTFIGDDAYSGTAGEVRQYTAGLNTVVVADVDGDSTNDFRIVLIGTHTLTAADFVL
jgi:hypothetical protein